jgi:hypothetical protein
MSNQSVTLPMTLLLPAVIHKVKDVQNLGHRRKLLKM